MCFRQSRRFREEDVEERRPRFESSRERRDQLAQSFFAAAGEGDLEALERPLAADVVLHGDGGGKTPALGRPYGRARVARTLVVWASTAARAGGVAVRRVEVNGQPGAMLLDAEGGLLAVWALDIAEGQIQAVRSIVNPDKLRHLDEATR